MEKLVKDKKAQNMTLSTIIIIILGIVVLVFLIFGFSTGWGNFWDRIIGIGGRSNLDNVAQDCQLICASQSTNRWCAEYQTIKYGDRVEAWNGTGLSQVRESRASCENISKNPDNFDSLRIDLCPAISCP